MRSVLVLRGGALGDFIVSLPALAALRRQWPQAVIEFAGNATAAKLALGCGLIDRAHAQFEARWSALYAPGPLPAGFGTWLASFDLVVNYWPDPDGTLTARFPLRAGQTFASGSTMPTRTPAAAHYLAALSPLGVRSNDRYYALSPAQGPRAGDGPVAIHPGSGSPRKNWPADRWLELMAAIDAPILVLTGEAEADEWNEARLLRTPLADRLRRGSIQIAVNCPLDELARRLAACRLFLGHDSGVSHLAAACGCLCVLLFGPTDPAMWAPPTPRVHVIRRGLDLGAISVDEVLQAVGPPASAPARAGQSETASASSTRSARHNPPRSAASR